MKSTKIMLAIIATLLSTWTVISLIGWILSDLTLKECYTNMGTILVMLIFGWVPSFIVFFDLEEKLDKY